MHKKTPLEELTTLPRTPSRMVTGHFSPRFLPLDAFSVSVSRHTEWGGVIGPSDNVFPGHAVALDRSDGPRYRETGIRVQWQFIRLN